MKKQIIYWLALGLVVMIGCQKELSFEVGNTPSHGSLQSDASGDCLPKTVNGIYIAGTPLVPATNTITVQVNVAQTGTYVVNTDTVNGYFFRATGTFTALGATIVTLRSNGTPFAAGINNFVVSYDTTICDIQVTVLPAGAGAAVFTLAGSPSCTTPVIAGTYATSVPLNASNTVTLNVNVTTAGTYNVSTAPAVGGMIFSGTGSLLVGPQTIVLTGGGTPTVGGNNTIPVTVGASTCSFVINVVSAAVGTLDGAPTACTPVTVSGTYTVGTALTVTNTVQIRIDVTTAGAYSITASSVTAGFGFAKSGTVAVGNDQLITLDFTGGPPTTAGVHSFTVTFGTSTCTFTVTVGGATGAVGTLDGSPACAPITVNGTYTVGTPLTATNTAQVRIDVTTAGAYTITATSGTAGFGFSKSGTVAVGNDQLITLDFTGGPPTTAGPHTFTVTFGTSTCTFTVTVQPALSNDYFPRTTNSNWSYEWNDDMSDSLLRVVIPQTLTVAPNTYNIFMPDDGGGLDSNGNYSAGYYRKAGGDYFERFDYGAFIGYDNPGWAEYIMLKDNVAASTNWKTVPTGFPGTVSGTPLNLRFSYTIQQKDVPIIVTSSAGAVTYQNVIVVEEKIEVEVSPGVWQDATSTIDYYGKSYYARGIGLILFEAYNASNVRTDWFELRRYQVF